MTTSGAQPHIIEAAVGRARARRAGRTGRLLDARAASLARYDGFDHLGAWVMQIAGILLVGGLCALAELGPDRAFQSSVTALVAASLILTGPLQLAFPHFVWRCRRERRPDLILPNYHATLLLVTVVAGAFALGCALLSFEGQSIAYRLLMVGAFVLQCHLWLALSLLSDLRHGRALAWVVVCGVALTVGAMRLLDGYGLEGLLLGLVTGQVLSLGGLSALIYRHHRSRRFIAFDILRADGLSRSVLAIGLLYNIGVWVDQGLFWYAGDGQSVIGPLRMSLIYDTPVFLAALTILPGMVAFLQRIRSDVVARHEAFYAAVRGGSSYEYVEAMRDALIRAIRAGLYEVLRRQAIVAVLVLAAGGPLLSLLSISTLHLPLVYVNVISVSLQVMLVGVLVLLLYLERARSVIALIAGLVALNGALTWLSLQAGPDWYGYGFAGALVLMVLAALIVLDRRLDMLDALDVDAA